MMHRQAGPNPGWLGEHPAAIDPEIERQLESEISAALDSMGGHDQAHRLRSLVESSRAGAAPSRRAGDPGEAGAPAGAAFLDLCADDIVAAFLTPEAAEAPVSRKAKPGGRRRVATEPIPATPPAPTPAPLTVDVDDGPLSTRAARVIAVASGKGGVGKTCVSVNLAAALTRIGLRVTLLDADLGTANADVLCGLKPHGRLEHVLAELPVHDGGRVSLAQIAVRAPGGFTLVPGCSGIARLTELDDRGRSRLLAMLRGVELDADVVLIDTGAGVSRQVTGFVGAADDGLIVVTPEPTSITDAYALIKCLVHARGAGGGGGGGPRLRVVVNQSGSAEEARETFGRLEAASRRFLGTEIELAGVIAQDPRVAQSVRARVPLLVRTPESAAGLDLMRLARVLAQDLGSSGVEPAARESGAGFAVRLWRALVGGGDRFKSGVPRADSREKSESVR